MKLNQLVSKSNRLRKLNARLVRVVGYKTGFDKKGIPTAVAKTYSPKEYVIGGRLVRAKDQNKYVSSIKFLDRSLNVKVSCSCPDYIFAGWEWSNAQVGAADIIYGNGEPPDMKNPDHKVGLCVAKNTLVTTITGDKLVQDVSVEDLVLTLDGWKAVLAHQRTGKKEVLQVTTRRGTRIEITEDHKVLSFKNDKFGWYAVGDLDEGDLLVHLTPPTQSSGRMLSINPEAVTAGILIAEADEFGYAPVEPKVRSIFEKNYKRVFGALPSYKNPRAAHIQLTDIDAVSSALGFTYKASGDQRLPKAFLTASLEFRSSLVYGLFLGDGNVSDTDASYGSSSHKLAKDVKQLLRTLGVYSAIRKNGTSKLWHVRVSPFSRGKLLSYFGKLKFKYDLCSTKHTPTGGCTEERLDIDLHQWSINLRQAAYSRGTLFPKTLSFLEKVGNDTLLPKLKEKYPSYVFRVRLEGSKKPTAFTYIEIKELLARMSNKSRFTSTLVPALPSKSKSKVKFRDWLDLVKVSDPQLVFFKKCLQPGVTIEQIKDIRSVGIKSVYDLSVADAEHFTANGIVVHNCKHLLALRAIIKEKNGV